MPSLTRKGESDQPASAVRSGAKSGPLEIRRKPYRRCHSIVRLGAQALKRSTSWAPANIV